MSKDFTNELIKNEIKISMDDEKRTLDTVFIEKFGCSLKQKKIHLILVILNIVKEVKNLITDYIIFYNNKRIHKFL
jgi:hypothetical protein